MMTPLLTPTHHVTSWSSCSFASGPGDCLLVRMLPELSAMLGPPRRDAGDIRLGPCYQRVGKQPLATGALLLGQSKRRPGSRPADRCYRRRTARPESHGHAWRRPPLLVARVSRRRRPQTRFARQARPGARSAPCHRDPAPRLPPNPPWPQPVNAPPLTWRIVSSHPGRCRAKAVGRSWSAPGGGRVEPVDQFGEFLGGGPEPERLARPAVELAGDLV